MNILLNEVFIPQGSTIGIGRGTGDGGKTVWFGGDHRPMSHLAEVLASGEEPEVSIDSWQVITDMGMVCEMLGHDFKAEDVADGEVGGGAAHVWAVYCTRCDAEGDEEDLE